MFKDKSMPILRFRVGPFPQASSGRDEIELAEDKGRIDMQGDIKQLAALCKEVVKTEITSPTTHRENVRFSGKKYDCF